MSDARPIGVFDSGLGGLTVFKEIVKLLPNEDVIYLGDTARVPYGSRSKEVVQKFSMEDSSFLMSKGVKCIVIACNTASAFAGDYVKRKLSVPVFEVVKGAAKKAGEVSQNKKIGVIGTRGTVSSNAYFNAIKIFGKDINVYSEACPLLVPFIEEGEVNSNALRIVTKKYLDPLKKRQVDTLIMGCTHYPIIKKVIDSYIDHHKVKLVDPGQVVALTLFNYLTKQDMLNSKKKSGVHKFFVTDLTPRFVNMAEMFLGHKLDGKISKIIL